MTEEPMLQHETDEGRPPAFVCPACGYACAVTWATRPAHTPDAIFYERGKVLVAIARQMPLWTVCIHPDGTSSDSVADTTIIQGRSTRRMRTPEETPERRATPGPHRHAAPEAPRRCAPPRPGRPY